MQRVIEIGLRHTELLKQRSSKSCPQLFSYKLSCEGICCANDCSSLSEPPSFAQAFVRVAELLTQLGLYGLVIGKQASCSAGGVLCAFSLAGEAMLQDSSSRQKRQRPTRCCVRQETLPYYSNETDLQEHTAT